MSEQDKTNEVVSEEKTAKEKVVALNHLVPDNLPLLYVDNLVVKQLLRAYYLKPFFYLLQLLNIQLHILVVDNGQQMLCSQSSLIA